MAKRGKGGRFTKSRARSVVRKVGRRVRRAAGAFRRATRGRSLGLVGKTGVGLMAGAPLLGSALEAATIATTQMRQQNLGLFGTAQIGFWRFINGLSNGFGGGAVMDTVHVGKQDGTIVQINVQSSIPSGAWYKTLVPGGILVALDIGISYLSRKLAKVNSGVRFLGTKLTGGK